jgi:hypothetical protein
MTLPEDEELHAAIIVTAEMVSAMCPRSME